MMAESLFSTAFCMQTGSKISLFPVLTALVEVADFAAVSLFAVPVTERAAIEEAVITMKVNKTRIKTNFLNIFLKNWFT